MLKQMIRNQLEAILRSSLEVLCDNETLAYDITKQCISEEDAQNCLDKMLEYISEDDLKIILITLNSSVYRDYTEAIDNGLRVIQNKVSNTLKLLTEVGGNA